MPKVDRVLALGLTFLVLFGAFIVSLLSRYTFPLFEYSSAPSELLRIDVPNLGQMLANFLWSFRPLDLILLALVLFGAAACCLAMVRGEREEDLRSP
ncbi:MAG TPA: hypothetical protein VJ574_08040 [Candidatus Bathyarchaeia archaeon]|nr:MAG: hypothetical protein A3K70_04065 [Candidatus Bathyarchaeota archaeon RBG_16_48_13]HJX24333.1 hypothetical protein [Candidatus Bathyarchaeia archaeon]